MKYNYLIAIMNEKGFSRTTLADSIGMKYPYLCKRLNGYIEFDVGEIRKIITVLDLSDQEIRTCFNFGKKVS